VQVVGDTEAGCGGFLAEDGDFIFRQAGQDGGFLFEVEGLGDLQLPLCILPPEPEAHHILQRSAQHLDVDTDRHGGRSRSVSVFEFLVIKGHVGEKKRAPNSDPGDAVGKVTDGLKRYVKDRNNSDNAVS